MMSRSSLIFFNAQMFDRESTSQAVIVSTCYENSPWLFNNYATPKTLIIQNYVLSGHPTIKVQIPTEDAIRQSDSDLGSSSSWISECLDWRTNRQLTAIEVDLPFVQNPSPVEQIGSSIKKHNLYEEDDDEDSSSDNYY
jgi:hypothetical protein